MSDFIWPLILMAAAITAMTAAYMAHLACRSAAAALERAASRSSEAIRLASLAIDKASSAIASVRSSRSSRFADAESVCRIISDSTQAEASSQFGESGGCPCSPSAISRFTAAGPMSSKCARLCSGSAIETPNVRVKPAPTAWRAGPVGENVQRTAGRARVTRRWGSA